MSDRTNQPVLGEHTGGDRYGESQLQQLLAEDPRIAELGIRIVRVGDGWTLCGEVETRHRRELIEQIVAAAFPGIQIHVDIGITRVHEPDEVEEL